MASVPFIRTFLSTEHLDGDLGAHDRAERAAPAGFLAVFRGVVSLVIEAFGDLYRLVRTDGYAQLACLAQDLIDGNLSFCSHSFY